MNKKNSENNPSPSEITPEELFHHRRRFLAQSSALTAGGVLPAISSAENIPATKTLANKSSPLSTAEQKTSLEDVTTINNFYEFGTGKSDPSKNAHTLQTTGWKISVEGAVQKPQVLDLDALLKLAPMEERIYRLRCVEAWSMVVPWIGYSLSELIKRVEPTGNAKFVEFISLDDPKQMPGVKSTVLDWPYVEALRLDEAMHPLTLLCFGLYGKALPNQNGAPVRTIIPWKYGFKSGKSIVKIRFTETMPTTSWMRANPREYGFYANVNPSVPHPRWSQAAERRIGVGKQDTRLFNGYDQVASLYSGMDLSKFF